MKKTKIMEGLNESSAQIGGAVSSNKSTVVKVLVGAVGVAAGIGAAIFLKNKKAQKAECVDSETIVDDNE